MQEIQMSEKLHDPFGARASLGAPGQARPTAYYDLNRFAASHNVDLARLPFSIRVLLENLLRKCDGYLVREEDVLALASYNAAAPSEREIPFMPARVVLQDFTGVPAVVDLAALREAMQRLGGDPARINPLVPADLVIDHSVQVDYFGSEYALLYNARLEFERNRERYTFLRWGQQAFDSFRVVPPATGIVHQVNLEYLASVVMTQDEGTGRLAFFDTLVGTDSHTTMINGLGVLGWGVGGIEAEAVLLGQPYFFQTPRVVGVKLSGQLREGVTATDLVLRLTELLRAQGVVGAFVEYFGQGLSGLSLADRATIANMAPEYGATCGFFPIDAETLRYLNATGRPAELVTLVEAYTKAQGLFRTDEMPDPVYSALLELDLASVEPSLAGPRRPQDRVPLSQMKPAFLEALGKTFGKQIELPAGASATPAGTANARADLYAAQQVAVDNEGTPVTLSHGSVVIAAITSCTNTSNPSVMVAAGLLAQKAVARGLSVQPHVKTSLAPGSRVVTDYLKAAGLLEPLEALRFHVVGYGCTTCIGNSGTITEPLAKAIEENGLVAAAVLSGNRNFEGRILPQARANFLASPPLVVAYALAGTVDIDLYHEPLGTDPSGQPVYLKDLWPSKDEIQQVIESALSPQLYTSQYGHVFLGNEQWQAIPVPAGDLYAWEDDSTYIQNPPFFATMGVEPAPLSDIHGARVLALLGDSVTTDHISPAGSIPAKSPAGQYLISKGVEPKDFNSYGARRGNHEVMMRGTFANIRLRNKIAPGTEGGVTLYLPTGEQTSIYEASMRYQAEGIPLIVLAGKEYGTGSSRDWAAKGTALLGVKAVIAESYERIHRSNLVGMGVLPLQFLPGQSAESLGLSGREVFDIVGLASLTPGQTLGVQARREDGATLSFDALVRLDTLVEVDYYRQGGILPAVLRKLLPAAQAA
jgi:aconitate hydratase